MVKNVRLFRVAGLMLACCLPVSADDDGKSAKTSPSPRLLKIESNEPRAKKFSLDRAIEYLDSASMAWTRQKKCFTCHTNFMHLVATAGLDKRPSNFGPVKKALDSLVNDRWPEKGPRWDAEVVMAATTLALTDRACGQKMQATTRAALDRIWRVQRSDGGFDWLKCDWPPMESDDEFGAAIAAVGVSAIPGYSDSESAKAGVLKLRKYIEANGLKRLHHQALLIWADSLGGKWLSDGQKQDIVRKLVDLQRPDGGWNAPSLGKWNREDGAQPDFSTSDGYGTGFAVFILRQAGFPKNHPAIRKGIEWLKTNQRQSGRWFTRSMSHDNQHYLTHAGTAMAIMALRSCQ